MVNKDKAIALLRQHGLDGLGGHDGCDCCYFNIQGVEINISCHKSGHSIRVYANDRIAEELEAIAKEVQAQMLADYHKWENAEPEERVHKFRVRFCEYTDDHTGGRWEGTKYIDHAKCCWCSAPREDRQAYLCPSCLQKPEAIQMFPWTGDGFLATYRALEIPGSVYGQ